MSITKDELLIAATAADKWPAGKSNVWTYGARYRPVAAILASRGYEADALFSLSDENGECLNEVGVEWRQRWDESYLDQLEESPERVAERFREWAEEVPA